MDAIRKGITRYTAVDGTAELKDAIIAKFKRDNGLTYERSQILVSSGAKQTCFNACAALLDPGDECVIPGALLGVLPRHGVAGGRRTVERVCGASQGYKITPAQLAGRDHASHQDVHHQQSEQSDRSGLYEGGTSGARRGSRQASADRHRLG